MRNDDTAEKDERIEQLQRQIRALTVRTGRLEEQLREHTNATPVRQDAETEQYNPAVGDHVHFRATKITPGGAGLIVRVVRNFVIIQRNTGEQVQRAPKNITLIRRGSSAQHGK